MSKLTFCGHSMGGITSLEACHRIDKFKICIALDPFFKPRWEQIEVNSDFVGFLK
jgi:alpha-beta hydrolase superfamily lysophospholipase